MWKNIRWCRLKSNLLDILLILILHRCHTSGLFQMKWKYFKPHALLNKLNGLIYAQKRTHFHKTNFLIQSKYFNWKKPGKKHLLWPQQSLQMSMVDQNFDTQRFYALLKTLAPKALSTSSLVIVFYREFKTFFIPFFVIWSQSDTDLPQSDIPHSMAFMINFRNIFLFCVSFFQIMLNILILI